MVRFDTSFNSFAPRSDTWILKWLFGDVITLTDTAREVDELVERKWFDGLPVDIVRGNDYWEALKEYYFQV